MSRIIYLIFSLLVSSFAVADINADINADVNKMIASCAACHNSDGNSTNGEWPILAGQNSKYLLKQLQDIKSDAREVPLMSGLLDEFNDEQLRQIADFYSSKQAIVSGAEKIENKNFNLSSDDMLALGKNIYRNGIAQRNIPACMSCHSPIGEGNSLAGYPKVGGQHKQYLIKQLKQFRSFQRKNDGDSELMRSSVINLRDVELVAVANYMSGLVK